MEINFVKIYNDKITVSHWDDEEEIWKENNISEIDVSFYRLFRHIVYFDRNLTIKGFLEQLKPYKEIIDNVFISSSGGFKLDNYLNNLDKNPDEESNLSYIEFYRSVEIWDDELSEYCAYHGIVEGEKMTYSLSFTEIKNFKHLFFKLNTDYEIYDYNKKEKINKPILSCKKDFTFYEVIEGFIYELTFFGTPDDQKEKEKEIFDEVEKIKSGEIKTSPIEELILKTLEEDLENAISSESYEEADKLKKEIKEYKDKLNSKKDKNER